MHHQTRLQTMPTPEPFNVPAVTDDMLKQILQRFGLMKHLDDGELHCCHCDSQISMDRIGALLVKQGTLLIYCNLLECIEDATRASR